MNYEVSFSPSATADLADLYDYIFVEAGHGIASAYVAKIYKYCIDFNTFPHRGADRGDIRPGLRTVGFQRQATIAFSIFDEHVTILRVFYGGRDISRLLAYLAP